MNQTHDHDHVAQQWDDRCGDCGDLAPRAHGSDPRAARAAAAQVARQAEPTHLLVYPEGDCERVTIVSVDGDLTDDTTAVVRLHDGSTRTVLTLDLVGLDGAPDPHGDADAIADRVLARTGGEPTPEEEARARAEVRSSVFLTQSIPAGLFSDLWAHEVDTLTEDAAPGRAQFAQALRAATGKGPFKVTLTREAAAYAASPNGSYANTADILDDQGEHSRVRAANRLLGEAQTAISEAVAREEALWQADLAAHEAPITLAEARALLPLLAGTGSEVFAANYSSDCDCEPVDGDDLVTCCWDGLQVGDFDDLDDEEAEAMGPFKVNGSEGIDALTTLREVEVELEDGTAVVDATVAEHIAAGYSVGEAEDIADHDEGEHDEESVPGCPRCEALYDDIFGTEPEDPNCPCGGVADRGHRDDCPASDPPLVDRDEPIAIVGHPEEAPWPEDYAALGIEQDTWACVTGGSRSDIEHLLFALVAQGREARLARDAQNPKVWHLAVRGGLAGPDGPAVLLDSLRPADLDRAPVCQTALTTQHPRSLKEA